MRSCSRVSVLSGVLCLLLNVTLNAQGPDTLWTRAYGGTGNEVGWSVEETSDGGYVVVGYTTSFPASSRDVYLIKADSIGDRLWFRIYGGTGSDVGYSVQETSDGGYIVAGWTERWVAEWDEAVYLTRTDTLGYWRWTKLYGGTGDDRGWAVRQTSDEGYIIVGYTNSFGTGGTDVYLIRTDADGDTLWTRTYGGPEDDCGSSIQETSDGGYIVAGFTESFGLGYDDVYLVRADENGDTLWTKTFGGLDIERGYSVQETADGGYVVAGWTSSYGEGGSDVYLVKTDADGGTLWTETYGGPEDDFGWSVQQTSDGGYIITGRTESFGSGHSDVYLIRLGPPTFIRGDADGTNDITLGDAICTLRHLFAPDSDVPPLYESRRQQ